MSNSTDFREIQRHFTAHLRNPRKNPAPEGIEDRRLAIYRRLVFGNSNSLLKSRFPVIHRLFSDDEWNNTIRDFLIKHRAQTPLFPEMGQEFVAYINQYRNNDPEYPFLLELAHYEYTGQSLVNSAAGIDDVSFDPDGNILDGIPVFSPLACVLGYQWPVHRIRPDYRPVEQPGHPTWLLLHRNKNNKRSFLEVKPATARLAQCLQENTDTSGSTLIEQFAEELGRPGDANVIASASQQLQILRQKGILLGTVL